MWGREGRVGDDKDHQEGQGLATRPGQPLDTHHHHQQQLWNAKHMKAERRSDLALSGSCPTRARHLSNADANL